MKLFALTKNKITLNKLNQAILCITEIPALLQYLREEIGSDAAILLYDESFPEVREVLTHLLYCYPSLRTHALNDPQLYEWIESVAKNIITIKGCHFHKDDIIYLEKAGRKLTFHFKDYTRSLTISMVALPDLDALGLVRCHESYVINLKHLSGVSGQNFILSNNAIVPVSRPYLKVLQKYRRLLRREQSPAND